MRLSFCDEYIELPFVSDVVTQPYLDFLAQNYKLSHNGAHGVEHWLRVLINGRLIAKHTGADIQVVEHFALLHDALREDEHLDPAHGQRASDFVYALWNDWIHLTEHQMELLRKTCRVHSTGRLTSDITAQTCWDADRLDLGRIGIKPNPTYLGTKIARDPKFLKSAYQRSSQRFVNYTFTEYRFNESSNP
jgi:uncharacterized protein